MYFFILLINHPQMNSTQQQDFRYEDKATSFFRKKYTSTAAFAVGILLFFLPFAELRCNDSVLASNTGIGLATGKEWKTYGLPGYGDMLKGNENPAKDGKFTSIKDWPNILTLISLLAAVAGLIISLTNSKLRAVVSMSAGILAAVLLIGMMIQMNHELKDSMAGKKGEPDYGAAISMFVKMNYTIWYYMAVVAFVFAAFFGFKHHKIEEKDALDRVIDFEFQQREAKPHD